MINSKRFRHHKDDTILILTEIPNNLLAIGKDLIAVGTACYGNVKGELITLDKTIENIDYNLYDHIVEGGLKLKSGVLQILDCPNSSVEMELKLKPGNYRIRVYSSNIASVIYDDGNDYYKIEIWPDDNMECKVLKKYITSPPSKQSKFGLLNKVDSF